MFDVHAFPAVRHTVVSGTHLLAVQVPLQHWAFDVQLPLSETHVVEHLPPTQLKLQHSVDVLHAAPLPVHTEVLAAHVCFVASQILEQQSAPEAQTSPNLWHVEAVPPVPTIPPEPPRPAVPPPTPAAPPPV